MRETVVIRDSDRFDTWEMCLAIYECPNCNESIIGDDCRYCSNCGVRILWIRMCKRCGLPLSEHKDGKPCPPKPIPFTP